MEKNVAESDCISLLCFAVRNKNVCVPIRKVKYHRVLRNQSV